MGVENVIIIGSGPAGHAAAIYAARARLEPLLFEGLMAAGVAAGGQLTTTTEVENFPGFPKGILGPELMENMRQQSLACGARIETKTVDGLDLKTRPFRVFSQGQQYQTNALIIATGATAKRLGIKGEDLFWQKGISACAVCDGALPIFRDQIVGLVGGGDAACEEATYLTKYAKNVLMFVRRNVLRASEAMQERVLNNPKIQIFWETHVIEAKGDSLLRELIIKNVKSEQVQNIPVSGLFYAIGHTPNTSFIENQIKIDQDGYIITLAGTTQTSVSGVFACGDVQDKIYRQAITAAGSGCMAALEADRYIKENIK